MKEMAFGKRSENFVKEFFMPIYILKLESIIIFETSLY